MLNSHIYYREGYKLEPGVERWHPGMSECGALPILSLWRHKWHHPSQPWHVTKRTEDCQPGKLIKPPCPAFRREFHYGGMNQGHLPWRMSWHHMISHFVRIKYILWSRVPPWITDNLMLLRRFQELGVSLPGSRTKRPRPDLSHKGGKIS